MMKRSVLLLFTLLLSLVATASMAQTVTTDKGDYAPGETVVITGSGFHANETVILKVYENDGLGWRDDDTWSEQTDGQGNFSSTWAVTDAALNRAFILTADCAHGLHAECYFTDAAAHVVSFGTSGLPLGTSVTVGFNGTNNGGNPQVGSVMFSSPGPSAGTGFLDGSSLSFSFPATLLSGTYALTGTSHTNPTTLSGGGPTTITGTYALVSSNTPPDITCPGNKVANTAPNLCTASVSFVATATGTPAPTITYSIGMTTITSPYDFPVGETTVTATATNSAGTDTCTFKVTVTDDQDPTIECPQTVSVNNDPDKCEAVISDLGTPTTDDNCGVQSVTNDHPSTTFPVGSTTVTWTVTDIHGRTATCQQTVTVTDNEDPTIECPQTVSVNNDPDKCEAVISDLGTPTTDDNCGVQSVTNDHPSTTFPVGSTTVTWTVTDIHGHTATCQQTVTVTDNEQPTITCPDNKSVDNDPGKCEAVISDLGTPETGDNCGVQTVNNDHPSSVYPVGTTMVTWTVTDVNGNSNTCIQTVTVKDAEDPTVCITGPTPDANVFPVNTFINFSGVFTENCTINTGSAFWQLDSQPSFPGTVNVLAGTISGSKQVTSPGVYSISLGITDMAGNAASTNTMCDADQTPAFVVVYDPKGGFVTGGGWINSPAGAYPADPSIIGKATFGFVSKYPKSGTIPTGNTEFQFKAGNINFNATVYEWLVVAGSRAQYKGSGTINGGGNYGFILTAVDGQITGGGGQDKFRIKIWDKNNSNVIVYDNQLGAPDGDAPTTCLGGGSIVIHK